MATHTTYYNLTKPSQNDKVNIGVLNDNADIIDTALHNKVDSDDLTADNVTMSDGVTSVEDVVNNMHMASNTVTLPYTPPTDGIIIATIRGRSAGESYVLFNGTTPNVIAANIVTNQFYNGLLAVKKGIPVSISASSNIFATNPYDFNFINISTN